MVRKAVVYTRQEHGIPAERIDSDAVRVIGRLRDSGFEAYIVGGAVRDLIVGKTPKDFDIVTSATPSKIKRLFRNSRIIGRRFRLVHVLLGRKVFEVSTFRSIKEGSVGNEFGTMDEDVLRRDFTLNSLYYDPLKEQVIDYTGGVNDIRKGVVRPVIPLGTIFEEDPVRMLRAVKYSATTKCRLPGSVRRKIRRSAHLLSPVSPSRLTEELLKIVSSGHAYEIVRQALDCDIFMYLQPAAASMLDNSRQFEQGYLESLRQLDGLVARSPDSRLGERLVFLIRDFVSGMTDWSKEEKAGASAGELYLRVWSQCRNFVLPMNPPRTELDYAIRVVLKSMGVSVRAPRRFGRRQISRESSVEDKAASL